MRAEIFFLVFSEVLTLRKMTVIDPPLSLSLSDVRNLVFSLSFFFYFFFFFFPVISKYQPPFPLRDYLYRREKKRKEEASDIHQNDRVRSTVWKKSASANME